MCTWLFNTIRCNGVEGREDEEDVEEGDGIRGDAEGEGAGEGEVFVTGVLRSEEAHKGFLVGLFKEEVASFESCEELAIKVWVVAVAGVDLVLQPAQLLHRSYATYAVSSRPRLIDNLNVP